MLCPYRFVGFQYIQEHGEGGPLFSKVLFYVRLEFSYVVRRAAAPPEAVVFSFLYPRSHWMRLAKMRSITLHKNEVRDLSLGRRVVCWFFWFLNGEGGDYGWFPLWGNEGAIQ